MPYIVDAVFVGRDQRLRLVALRVPAIHSLGDRLYIPERKRREEYLTGPGIHMIYIILLRRDPAIFSGRLQIEKQRISGLIEHPDPVFTQGQFRQNLIALVVAAVVHALHAVEDASLNGLQSVLNVWHGAFQYHIRRIVQEPVFIHAAQMMYGRGIKPVHGLVVGMAVYGQFFVFVYLVLVVYCIVAHSDF